ncbi:MAG TPA: polysaccharide pyruvyl transferase family protein [Xanthomonadaceae bacterium]|nr:polysaccharide pyruvyl transferase family protein [Xanthomonadaceae bacterium]
MQLHYCRIHGGNFGDDLNLDLWPRLFPDIARVHPETRLYGIGTILGGDQPPGPKVILGSGIGYRGQARPDPQQRVYWVRGPRTAACLGVDPALGLGDPALLWPALDNPRTPVPGRVGLVPHFRSLQRFDWMTMARAAGVHLVDPRMAPDAVAAEMGTCERVLCESLHGAICADAMGLPWRALVLARRFNDFKWRDWLDGLGLELRPAEMPVELLGTLSPLKAIGNAAMRLLDRGGPEARQQMRPLRAAGAREHRLAVRALGLLAAETDAFRLSDRSRVAAQRAAMRARCADFARDHGLSFTG